MVKRGFALWFCLLPAIAAAAGPAADLARAIRESTFDREECYRVRDLTLIQEDIRIYFTDGHLLFSKPVAGKRIAAVFTADTDDGDAEIMLLPPDRAERRALASYIDSPNLNEHFQNAVMVFTGDEYENLKAQIAASPANKKTPEVGPLLDEQWGSVLHTLGSSYQTRLALDLLGGAARKPDLFTGVFSGAKLGNFDVIYDPEGSEQIVAGRVSARGNQFFFDTWTSFQAKSFRSAPARARFDATPDAYRIEATINPDLSLSAVTRVSMKAAVDGISALSFEISPLMQVSGATVDGRPAEVLQRDALRANILRAGNELVVLVPPEPLRAGREYEIEFHHSGNVVMNAGGHVLYVNARGNWYPMHGSQFASYDLLFRYPKDLDLVTPGDVVEDRTEGEQRVTRRRTTAPIRVAGFNLGNYTHARVERGGYSVDVCANRELEQALKPRTRVVDMSALPGTAGGGRQSRMAEVSTPPVSPTGRLQEIASEVSSALEFMTSKFGPPALPHLTVSPIPGAFGQGFPGLIYLSTIAYLKEPPVGGKPQEIFFEDVLQAHETAHQWWGNRVITGAYRDYWLMEAMANYSALLYLEKRKGVSAVETMLEAYRSGLLEKNEAGQLVDSAGPIVLGTRLESSLEPRAWRAITYGKGSWILHMLRMRMGDERFMALLAEVARRYDRKEITTEAFRELASQYMPPKSDDPKLEGFFDQWVYGTGIPTLKLTYSVKGTAPALRLLGTITQTGLEGDFGALVPVEIQASRGKTITQWVRAGADPVTFTVPLKQQPLKVTLDPHYAVLRK
jgi:hypothetical protein